MSNIEQTKLLEKLADLIEQNARTPAEALAITKEVVARSDSTDSLQYLTEANSESRKGFVRRFAPKDLHMLCKYRTYFESWLDMPIDQIGKIEGVFVSSSEKRQEKPAGWLAYMPICALETEVSFIVSCIPEWHDDLQETLYCSTVSDTFSQLKEFVEKRKNDALVESFHNIYGLANLNPQIDTSSAVPLDYHHYGQYCEFMKKAYPSIYSLIEHEPAITKDYREMVEKKTHFCIIENDKIVSLTESENISNKPKGIISLGINTLKEYRRNGYASFACAAFVKQSLLNDLLPLWQCDFDNAASQALAEKIGFCHIGNVYSVSTLLESWKK